MNSLDDYTIEHILSYLNLKSKLKFERTAKRYQRIVLGLLQKQRALGTSLVDEYSSPFPHINTNHNMSVEDIQDVFPIINDLYYDWTREDTMKRIEFISRKCPNVTCLHIADSVIDPNSMQHITICFPKLDCVHLFHSVLKSNLEHRTSDIVDLDWLKIGRRLIHKINSLWIMPTFGYRLNNKQMKY